MYVTQTLLQYFSNIGYCPQENIIEEVLTGREMLVLFGKLRGLSVGLHKEIETLAKCLGKSNFGFSILIMKGGCKLP